MGTKPTYEELNEKLTALEGESVSYKNEKEMYQSLVNSITESIYLVDRECRYLFANQEHLSKIGKSKDAIIGQRYTDFHTTEQGSIFSEQIRKVFDTGQTVQDEHRSQKDGKYFLRTFCPVRATHEGPEVSNVAIIAKDITERREAEDKLRRAHDEMEARVRERTVELRILNEQLRHDLAEREIITQQLKESEENYRIIFETTGSAMAILEEDNTVSLVNSYVEVLTGYSKAEIESKMKWTEVVAAQDVGKMVDYLSKRWDNSQVAPTAYEFRLTDKNGDVKDVYLNVAMIPGTKRSVVALLDITDRKRTEEALQVSLERLRKALGGTVQAMAMTVETRDPYTAGHQRQVTNLARAIAQEMGLSRDSVDGIGMACVIHDIGKISVPAEILSKPTKLSELEFGMIKIHSQVGYDILQGIEFLWPVAQIVLQHHERMDGSGYPKGLKGEEILVEARILAVADVVEAIASHRPYRPAFGIEDALAEITLHSGTLYDPSIVDACLRLFREKGYILG